MGMWSAGEYGDGWINVSSDNVMISDRHASGAVFAHKCVVRHEPWFFVMFLFQLKNQNTLKNNFIYLNSTASVFQRVRENIAVECIRVNAVPNESSSFLNGDRLGGVHSYYNNCQSIDNNKRKQTKTKRKNGSWHCVARWSMVRCFI